MGVKDGDCRRNTEKGSSVEDRAATEAFIWPSMTADFLIHCSSLEWTTLHFGRNTQQETEGASPPVESGLVSWPALTKWVKWEWLHQFWAWAARNLLLEPLTMWKGLCQPVGWWKTHSQLPASIWPMARMSCSQPRMHKSPGERATHWVQQKLLISKSESK